MRGSKYQAARPTAHIATPPPGGKTGIAPLASPNPPTEDIVIFAGGVGLVAFCLILVRWEVIVERGVEGDRGGKEGVRSPYFGSTASVQFQIMSEEWRSSVYVVMMMIEYRVSDRRTYQRLQLQSYRPY
jgi:hypothetical protein